MNLQIILQSKYVSHMCTPHIFTFAYLYILLFYIQFVLRMPSSNHSQRHKHCKPDCVSHSAFACSLRKYSVSKSTHFSSVNHDLSKSRKKQNLQRKKSVSYIKPFVEFKQNVNQIPANANQHQKSNKKKSLAEVKNRETHQQQQIQSLIMKVSLEAKKNEGHRIQPYIIDRQNTKIIAPNQTEDKKVNSTKDADAFAKVKSKDFSQLQLNVDKISKIVDLFKKKVEGIQSFNASQKQQKNEFLELSQFTTQQRTPEPELENPRKPFENEIYSISPVLAKKQFNFESIQQRIKVVEPHQMSTIDPGSAETQKNRGSRETEKEEGEKGLILMKQNSRKMLNYKMYQGSSKIGYTGNKTSNKCHGHSIEM